MTVMTFTPPASTKFRYCAWDGEPAIYRFGKAFVHRDGFWHEASSLDVGMEARVLTVEQFRRLFPGVAIVSIV
jgi:hypothetical protein